VFTIKFVRFLYKNIHINPLVILQKKEIFMYNDSKNRLHELNNSVKKMEVFE